jgi:hypothetical protein
MLKKLMSFLFEEEEIVEEVVEKPTRQKEVLPTFHQQENQEKTQEEVVESKPKSIFVDSDETLKSTTTHQPLTKPTFDTYDSKKEKKEATKPTEYEFSSSISPIFGKMPEKEREPILVQPKIDLDQEKSVLGTIISPIYGIKKRQKVSSRVEKPSVVNKTMSLEDILGFNEHSNENSEQLTFDEQNLDEQPTVEKPKEEILMKLFEEESD